MSKINIEFDTVDKTMTASIGGVAVENVCGAHIYTGTYDYNTGKYDDTKYCCEICACEKDPENGMVTHTRVTASESDLGKKTIEGFEEHELLPGFKILRDIASKKFNRAQLVKAVAGFFGQEKNDE